jgi:hypothetical protein
MWHWIKNLFRKKKIASQEQIDALYTQLGKLEVVKKQLHKSILNNVKVKQCQAELNECNRLISNIKTILGI